MTGVEKSCATIIQGSLRPGDELRVGPLTITHSRGRVKIAGAGGNRIFIWPTGEDHARVQAEVRRGGPLPEFVEAGRRPNPQSAIRNPKSPQPGSRSDGSDCRGQRGKEPLTMTLGPGGDQPDPKSAVRNPKSGHPACPKCGSGDLVGPDHQGVMECRNCGHCFDPCEDLT